MPLVLRMCSGENTSGKIGSTRSMLGMSMELVFYSSVVVVERESYSLGGHYGVSLETDKDRDGSIQLVSDCR